MCKLNIFNCYDHLFPRIEHSKCYFFIPQDYVYDPSTVIGSEDCLYVNIFTKRGMEGDDEPSARLGFAAAAACGDASADVAERFGKLRGAGGNRRPAAGAGRTVLCLHQPDFSRPGQSLGGRADDDR